MLWHGNQTSYYNQQYNHPTPNAERLRIRQDAQALLQYQTGDTRSWKLSITPTRETQRAAL